MTKGGGDYDLNNYLCVMKAFYIDNYNKITIVFWVVFIVLLWLQYIYLSSFIEASLFLVVLIPGVVISYRLGNVWLPRAIYKKKIRLFAFQFLGATIFIAFLLAASYQLVRLGEVKGYLPHSLLLADNNSLLADFLFATPSTLLINFGSCGLRFFYENIKLQQVNMKAQLQMLQSQINPHFMFNVLNHIHVLMQKDVELASELLMQYADMLRFQLYKGKCDKVCLGEEVEFLKNFVEIEKLRRGDKLKVDTKWVVLNKQMEIPPLLLIPFVENAFKYASSTTIKQGFVMIELKQENEGFSFGVQNSKSAVNPKRNQEASGLGLDNTRQRLNLLYGEKHRLAIEDGDDFYNIKLEVW